MLIHLGPFKVIRLLITSATYWRWRMELLYGNICIFMYSHLDKGERPVGYQQALKLLWHLHLSQFNYCWLHRHCFYLHLKRKPYEITPYELLEHCKKLLWGQGQCVVVGDPIRIGSQTGTWGLEVQTSQEVQSHPRLSSFAVFLWIRLN